jgi:lysophospholipase-3
LCTHFAASTRGEPTNRAGRTLRILGTLICVFAVATLFGSSNASGHARARTPVVMFPAYFFTTLKVTVHNQTVAPECPRSGSFRVFFLNDEPTSFSTACQMKLLTLRYERSRGKPMRLRFSDQRGVDVSIENYGKTESAPF